jgi:hypothetical protein
MEIDWPKQLQPVSASIQKARMAASAHTDAHCANAYVTLL